MIKFHTFGMAAIVTAAAILIPALSASAQQPPAVAPAPPTKPAAPPVAKPVTPPAAQAPAKAAPAKAAAPKSASACKGLDETVCKANPECAYIVPKDANNKTGAVQKPYCRKVAGVAKKAADAKAPAVTAPVAPTAAAPAAVTPKPAAAKPAAPAPKQ